MLDMLARPCIPPMSWEHLCLICWPGCVFLQCLADTTADYAGQALYSSNVLGAPMLDMLARPCIPPMSWEHLCWICWPGFVFLQCPGNTYAGYAGQAVYSSNVLGTPMLDMLARPSIPLMSWEHLCWICWPGLVFFQCPGNTYAGYAGQALYSSNVLGTLMLDMLARLCIPPMSG